MAQRLGDVVRAPFIPEVANAKKYDKNDPDRPKLARDSQAGLYNINMKRAFMPVVSFGRIAQRVNRGLPALQSRMKERGHSRDHRQEECGRLH